MMSLPRNRTVTKTTYVAHTLLLSKNNGCIYMKVNNVRKTHNFQDVF